jgi:MinD-like ATPase involved in chromosome partitioning or flagellar assembly
MMGAQGGVGVSILSANLAVTLARQGLNVVLVDLNPSGANLHTHLGLEPLILSPSELLRLPPEPTLERLSWEPEALKEGGLWLCRPSLALHNATPVEHRVRALQAVRAQREVSFDVMLLDLGHHQDAFSLSRFHEAALSITVFKPTITSIERGHLLIRAALFQSLLGQGDDASIVARALLMADHVGQLNTPAALMTALERVNPEVAQVMKQRLLNFKPQLIMNQCRTHAERDLALDLCAVLQRKWRLEATPLGSIDYDESAQQWGRQRAQRPLTLEHAGRSSLCADLERLGKRLTRLLTQGVPS